MPRSTFAVALDQLGRRLGAIEIPTTTAGFKQLIDWASHFGVVEQFGIEGPPATGPGCAGGYGPRGWS